MKHASTSKLICIQLQLVSQINKAKDLFKKSKSGTAMKRKIPTCFRPLPRDCLKQLKNSPLGNFLNFEEGRTLAVLQYYGFVAFKKTLLSRSLCKSRYFSCSKFEDLHESGSALPLLVDVRILNTRE